MPFTRPTTPQGAWERLLAGNLRYVNEEPLAPVPSAERIELAAGQQPFAVVVGCSDSRVPVETIFDQPPGNLFVVRLAGNIISDEALASVEYGVAVLGAMLILVLGHTSCGAVQAALAHLDGAPPLPGHMQSLADAIAPAAAGIAHDERRWENAVRAQALASARHTVERSPLLGEAIARGALQCDAAVYDLHTGRVQRLQRA